MATNDLMTELQKDSIKLDDDSERKVTCYWTVVYLDGKDSCDWLTGLLLVGRWSG